MYWYMANCGKNVIVFVLLCTCIWGIYISVDMIFQSLWFLSWFPFLDRGLLLTKKILNPRFLVVMLKSFYYCHHGLVNRYGRYVSQMSTAMLCFRHFLFRDFISWFVTRVTRWVQLVEQKLVTLPEHLSASQDILDHCGASNCIKTYNVLRMVWSCLQRMVDNDHHYVKMLWLHILVSGLSMLEDKCFTLYFRAL